MQQTTVKRPYEEFASSFNQWVFEYEQSQKPRRKFNKTKASQEMGIHSSSLSKYVSGAERPTEHQCLILARFFGKDLEEVLRAAGYADLTLLAEQVAADMMPHEVGEKEYVLNVLHIAQQSPEWQKLDWRSSPFKERAEEILASKLDAYTKAVKYTDAVWEWYHSRPWDKPRWLRQTDDMLPVVS